MNKKAVKNLLTLFFTAAICAIASLSLHFAASDTPAPLTVLRTEGTAETEIAAYDIEDLPGLHSLRYANYTPDAFLIPHSDIAGEVVDLTSFRDFAARGTLQFVFLNLDPFDAAFTQKSEALAPYLGGDNSWHFTLLLPAFAGAANVYVRTELKQTAGEIENYNFIHYTEYEGETENHVSESKPFFIDLSFYANRHVMAPDLLIRATTVTIHYEAGSGAPFLFSSPLAGTDAAVRAASDRDHTFLLVVCVFSALLLAVLVFAAILKRTFAFLPQTLSVFGIFAVSFLRMRLFSVCAVPYAAAAMLCGGAVLIPAAALLSLREKAGRLPLWAVFAVVSLFFFAAALAAPFSPTAHALLPAGMLAVGGMLCVSLLLSALRGRGAKQLLIPAVAAAYAATCALFSPSILLLGSSALWLLVLLACTAAAMGGIFFIELERQNIYLTQNLQTEVHRQTDELHDIIDSREQLLRYLSHDLKKPVVHIEQAIAGLLKEEREPAKRQEMSLIERKIRGIRAGLTELQEYARQNYTAEVSAPMDIAAVTNEVCDALRPDCEAHGIRLFCETEPAWAFAKRNALVSVLNNLIFNAIEHARCTYVAVAVRPSARFCKITVTDDGVGIEPGVDAFRPYYTAAPQEENLGLGLYMCRQFMQSMGGDLTYERTEKRSVFSATVPFAPSSEDA